MYLENVSFCCTISKLMLPHNCSYRGICYFTKYRCTFFQYAFFVSSFSSFRWLWFVLLFIHSRVTAWIVNYSHDEMKKKKKVVTIWIFRYYFSLVLFCGILHLALILFSTFVLLFLFTSAFFECFFFSVIFIKFYTNMLRLHSK